jgi:hypothetical protein
MFLDNEKCERHTFKKLLDTYQCLMFNITKIRLIVLDYAKY